jgi:hypothetical protein
MKSYRKELWFNLPTRRGFVNITPDAEVSMIRQATLIVEKKTEGT